MNFIIKQNYLLIILIAQYSYSQNKLKFHPEINNYECALKKENKIDSILYKKGYYGKIFKIGNVITLTKSHFIHIDSENNIWIEITKVSKAFKQEDFFSLSSQSKDDVFILLNDLKKAIQENHNNCNLEKYYIRVDYQDPIAKQVHRYDYIFEYESLIKLLKDINKLKYKKEIMHIISQQLLQ